MGNPFRIRKQNNQNCLGNDGFSLLEVIISMTILALLAIPLLNYFTKSMRNSAMMAQRQNATLTAQEIIENLKAEDKLIQRTELINGNVVYQLPYLTDELGFSLKDATNFDETEGTGEIVYICKDYKRMGMFDVRVTLSTDISANTVERSLVYGIDDATDMLIIEQDQENEAMVYYTAANVEYCAGHPGASYMSQTAIKSHLERWICFDISYSQDERKYTVRAYYDYITTDASVTGEEGQHNTPGKSFTSSFLIDAKMASLKNLYLLYDRLDGSVKDTVCVKYFTDETNDATELDLYFLCQNFPTGSYELNFTNTDARFHYHANIRQGDGSNVEFKPMTQKGKPVRMIGIKTEVFEKDRLDSGDDSLVTMETTKGD